MKQGFVGFNLGKNILFNNKNNKVLSFHSEIAQGCLNLCGVQFRLSQVPVSSSSSILFVLAIDNICKCFTKRNKLKILHDKKRVTFLEFLKNIFILQIK